MKYMAVDYGTKRAGIAVSDELGMLARPLTTLDATDGGRLVAAVARLIAEHEPGEVIVGNPRRLSGAPGTLADAAEAFAAALRTRVDVPVTLRDERLTTVEAQERLLAAGAGRRKRRVAIDQAAAAVLL